MLQDYRELAASLKEKFQSITTWPEIEFNEEDKSRINELDDVTNLYEHSFQIEIDSNHCIIPGQYILYAICIKELALAVKEHMEFFELVKTGKSSNEIGALLIGQQFDFENISKDDYSKILGLRVFIDSELNQGAKSIVNGSAGNYTIRGISDFFTSIILKPINVPAASSSILGKFIYKLTEHPELYQYLEKRFINRIPFITKEQKINKFVRNVILFLLQYDGMGSIKNTYTRNAEPSLISIRDGSISLTSIFKTSLTLLDEEALSQGNRIRFFKDPIYYNDGNEFIYLSTEWTDGTNSRLDLSSFKALIEKHYSEFTITHENGTYYFKNIFNYSFNLANSNVLDLSKFKTDLEKAGLKIEDKFVNRFVSSLLAKPFVILTGLAGSGKTKLAQAFVQWIAANKSQYVIIPVGADWTNREPLLGYPNGLDSESYITPDSGALQLIIKALKAENRNKPYFMILDEMNLSHVERYFADFLSIMESSDTIKLYSGTDRFDSERQKIEKEISWPKNLFIIGTVNIDETTYMFSPKVLDRANVIEFRITPNEMGDFFEEGKEIIMEELYLNKDKSQGGAGQNMGKSFLEFANDKTIIKIPELEGNDNVLNKFFEELQIVGAEFGYRSATEMQRLITKLGIDSIVDKDGIPLENNVKIDIAIMQKLLPKLHGSRKKLVGPLETLAGFCLQRINSSQPSDQNKLKTIYQQYLSEDKDKINWDIKYPISFEKIERMLKNVIENGFTSYAEA